MMVRGAHGYEIHLPRGYLRGLAARNGYLFVGSTKGRNRSKSTGVLIDNAADPGESYGEPGVSVYNRDTEALDCFIDLSAYADEIYDILVSCPNGSCEKLSGVCVESALCVASDAG